MSHDLFKYLINTPIDSIYSNTALSPAYNDMNWSSFFATGNTKYLNNIISNVPHAENRTDLNLFLTGASAKWSLSSNATQDENVKKHLSSLARSNKSIKEILKKDPSEYRQEMRDIIAEQRAKGVWK